jgi:hypothetical protein
LINLKNKKKKKKEEEEEEEAASTSARIWQQSGDMRGNAGSTALLQNLVVTPFVVTNLVDKTPREKRVIPAPPIRVGDSLIDGVSDGRKEGRKKKTVGAGRYRMRSSRQRSFRKTRVDVVRSRRRQDSRA